MVQNIQAETIYFTLTSVGEEIVTVIFRHHV